MYFSKPEKYFIINKFTTFALFCHPYLKHLTFIILVSIVRTTFLKVFFRKTGIPVKIGKITCLLIDKISIRLSRLEFKGIPNPSKFLFLFFLWIMILNSNFIQKLHFRTSFIKITEKKMFLICSIQE